MLTENQKNTQITSRQCKHVDVNIFFVCKNPDWTSQIAFYFVIILTTVSLPPSFSPPFVRLSTSTKGFCMIFSSRFPLIFIGKNDENEKRGGCEMNFIPQPPRSFSFIIPARSVP